MKPINIGRFEHGLLETLTNQERAYRGLMVCSKLGYETEHADMTSYFTRGLFVTSSNSIEEMEIDSGIERIMSWCLDLSPTDYCFGFHTYPVKTNNINGPRLKSLSAEEFEVIRTLNNKFQDYREVCFTPQGYGTFHMDQDDLVCLPEFYSKNNFCSPVVFHEADFDLGEEFLEEVKRKKHIPLPISSKEQLLAA